MALSAAPEAAEPPPLLPPDILDYTEYRAFLGAYYLYKKSSRKGFSYRLFASKAKLKSPNYLQLVMQGKRNLSTAAATNVAKALGLSTEQRSYFLALVDLSLAKDNQALADAEKSRLQARSRLVMKQLPTTQREILSKPEHLLVRELCALKDFRFDPRWVANRLKGIATEESAAGSLALLVAGNYLKRDSSGAWTQSEPAIDTGHAFDEAGVLRHHVETLRLWTRLLDSVPKEQRELGLLNIPIDSAKIPEFKRRIHAFQNEIIGWLESETNADTVVQLGTYMIPLTKP